MGKAVHGVVDYSKGEEDTPCETVRGGLWYGLDRVESKRLVEVVELQELVRTSSLPNRQTLKNSKRGRTMCLCRAVRKSWLFKDFKIILLLRPWQ